MSGHFAIHHHTEFPAYYDIFIEREKAISIFRIIQYDMIDFLDGNEIKAEEIDPVGVGNAIPGIPAGFGKGPVRLFDSGSCVIEIWSPPVYIIQIATRQFYGTLHILKVEEGYSLRYLRSRYKLRTLPPVT